MQKQHTIIKQKTILSYGEVARGRLKFVFRKRTKSALQGLNERQYDSQSLLTPERSKQSAGRTTMKKLPMWDGLVDLLFRVSGRTVFIRTRRIALILTHPLLFRYLLFDILPVDDVPGSRTVCRSPSSIQIRIV